MVGSLRMTQPGSHSLLWLLLLLCSLGSGGAGGKRWRDGGGKRPEFGETADTVTVEVGQSARLPCLVLHLKDRAVTWLRRRDLHILTTGRHTYSADDRFQVVTGGGGVAWPLVVRSAQPRDSGVYECQVNTDPKISRPITLHVHSQSAATRDGRQEAEPTRPLGVTKSKVFVANQTSVTRDGHLRVEIVGASEVNIEEGSSLSLTCVVTSTLGAAAVVYWYHDTQLQDYHNPRGGVKIKIDQEQGVTVARLVVVGVGVDDTGFYSCVAPGTHPASIRVHVHTGKQEAAIQQSGLNDTSSSSSLLLQPLPQVFLLSLLPPFLLLPPFSLLPTFYPLSDILPSSLFTYFYRPFPHAISRYLYFICLAISQTFYILLFSFSSFFHSIHIGISYIFSLFYVSVSYCFFKFYSVHRSNSFLSVFCNSSQAGHSLGATSLSSRHRGRTRCQAHSPPPPP